MILCFPDANPDELFYSICARYSDKVHYSRKTSVIEELFGKATYSAIIDLPNHLDYLCANLSPETYYTFKTIVLNHTLLPLYTPFLFAKQRQILLEEMHQSVSGMTPFFRPGWMKSNRISLPEWLRFCPLCVVEDRIEWGECYWHRTHQVLGVEVCPRHKVYLQNSVVSTRERRWYFISAERVIPPSPPSISADSDPHLDILIRIALDVSWLLNHHHLEPQPDLIHKQYEVLLSHCDMATYGGKVNINELIPAFKAYYPRTLLKQLKCEFNENRKENWLVRLTRKPYHAQLPLRHLLLMQFLGCRAEDFFCLPSERKPFGNGPWPCLNPICQHYHLLKIDKHDLIYSHRPGTKGRPIGIFSCECGFIYSRTGPDKSPEDLFKIGKVKSYGFEWEAKLQELCEDKMMQTQHMAYRLGVAPSTIKRQIARLELKLQSETNRSYGTEWKKSFYALCEDFTLTRREIALQLGVSLSTLERRASKLGVSFSSSRERFSYAKIAEGLRFYDMQPPDEEARRMYRIAWLSVLQENPRTDIRALSKLLPQGYRWLYYHDSEWLRQHLPERNRGTLAEPRGIPWESKDAQLAEAVEASAFRLKSVPGQPIWITANAISKDIGKPGLRQYLDKLPLTAKVLSEVVETREMFAIRRIHWIGNLYHQEKRYPSRMGLIVRAGVRKSIGYPKVQLTIDTVLQDLSCYAAINIERH